MLRLIIRVRFGSRPMFIVRLGLSWDVWVMLGYVDFWVMFLGYVDFLGLCWD